MDLVEIYLLNLSVTVGMFVVMMARAWVEVKNYRLMWRQIEWVKTREAASRILRAERVLFSKVEGGEELYELLCNLFDVQLEDEAASQDSTR